MRQTAARCTVGSREQHKLLDVQHHIQRWSHVTAGTNVYLWLLSDFAWHSGKDCTNVKEHESWGGQEKAAIMGPTWPQDAKWDVETSSRS